MAAPTISKLAHAGGVAPGQYVTTGSINFDANSVILVSVTHRSTSGAEATISNTGTALTWTKLQSDSVSGFGGTIGRHTVWAGVNTSAQTGVTVTADFASQGPNGAIVVVVQAKDSEGTQQSKLNKQTSVTDLTVTLDSALQSDSACVAFFFSAGSNAVTFTAKSGWTELYDGGGTVRDGHEAQSGAETNCTATASYSGNTVSIIVEVLDYAAPAAAGGLWALLVNN